MFEIVHGGGGLAAAGRGVVAAAGAVEMQREAARREAAFQQEQALAEAQLAITQQRGDLMAQEGARAQRNEAWGRMLDAQGLLDSRDDRRFRREAFDVESTQRDRTLDMRERQFNAQMESQTQDREIAGRNADLRAREMDLRARAMESEQAIRDLGLEQEEAERAWNMMRYTGVDPVAMGPAFEAAGNALGGGVGEGLKLLANMAPPRAEVFRRMSTESQARFLQDEAAQAQQQRSIQARVQGAEAARHLAGVGALTPEEAQAYTQRIAEAEDDEGVVAVMTELDLARSMHVERAVRQTARDTLVERMGNRRKMVAQALAGIEFDAGSGSAVVKGMEDMIQSIDERMNELAADPFPDIESEQRRWQGFLRGIPEDQGGGQISEPIDVNGLRQEALNPTPPEVPPTPFSEWEEEAGEGNRDVAVNTAAWIVSSDQYSEDERAEQWASMAIQYGFNAEDPAFLELVRKRVAEMKKEGRDKEFTKSQHTRADVNWDAVPNL